MKREIEAVNPEDFAEVAIVWEASVRATHHFLSEADIIAYKAQFPGILHSMDLYCVRERGFIAGFIGVAGKKVQVLFIRPENRFEGIGRLLMKFAIEQLGADQVDVNEQNESALGFYKTLGFEVIGRTERDGLNKPFPLLHLQLV